MHTTFCCRLPPFFFVFAETRGQAGSLPSRRLIRLCRFLILRPSFLVVFLFHTRTSNCVSSFILDLGVVTFVTARALLSTSADEMHGAEETAPRACGGRVYTGGGSALGAR